MFNAHEAVLAYEAEIELEAHEALVANCTDPTTALAGTYDAERDWVISEAIVLILARYVVIDELSTNGKKSAVTACPENGSSSLILML